jgi:hypothetical protein
MEGLKDKSRACRIISHTVCAFVGGAHIVVSRHIAVEQQMFEQQNFGLASIHVDSRENDV